MSEFDVDINSVSEPETETFETDIAVSEPIVLTIESLENWPEFDLEKFRIQYKACRHLTPVIIQTNAQIIEDKLINYFDLPEAKNFNVKEVRLLNSARYQLLFKELLPDIRQSNDFDVEQDDLSKLESKLEANANRILRQIADCKAPQMSRVKLI